MPNFNIGDKIRIKEGVSLIGAERFTGEAIFRGNSTTNNGCLALERLDGINGCAQNNWWNFKKEDLDKLELVIPEITEVIIDFSIGEKIKFITNNHVPPFVCDIPQYKGGGIIFKKNEGTVIGKHNEYFVVSYIDEYENEVVLGLLGKYLIPLNEKNKFGEKTMTIKEYRKIAKVGDKVIISSDENTEGIVGEIDSDYFCFWNDYLIGLDGKLKPIGYKYSRVIGFNSSATITVLNEKKVFTQKRKAYIEIVKETGKIYISIKMPSEVEKFFKQISEEKLKVSNAWFQDKKPAQYYSQPVELERKLLQIDNYIYSDFGSGLVKDRNINVAVLRTVGISKGVKLHSASFDSFTNADLQDYVKRLGIYVKRLWESNISTTRIKSVITYEI